MEGRNSRRQDNRRRPHEAAARWTAELVARFSAALGPEARSRILTELDLPHPLDEDAALALYRMQPQLASGFIQRHLPRGRRADDEYSPWQRLMEQAQARGDEALYFALYRTQAPSEQWLRDTSELANGTADPEVLCAELERRHPNRWRHDIGPQLAQLALRRGEHLLPYLMQHAHEIWSAARRSGYQQMAELSRSQGWLELWAALVRSCASAAEYDREVMALVQDQISAEPDVRHRLLLLAGAPLAPTAKPRTKPLRDSTVLALYDRFPHLARGPFRQQLEPSPSRTLAGLIERAMERRDDELIDHLCARLAVCAERSGAERLLQTAAAAASYLKKPSPNQADQAQRACAILRRVPPRAIRNQRDLMRRNPLARLLFERAGEACLVIEGAAADLLQADEDHVCAVAVIALTGDDPRALVLARQNRDLLLATLERRLPRRVARQAVRALDRLADEPAAASQILIWARRTLAQGSPYPAGELIALIARQLRRYPALREAQETPPIYRTVAA